MGINKDQVKGQMKQVGGTIKEATGKAVGNEKLEQRGKTEKVRGKAQEAIGDIKEVVKKAVDKI